MTDGEMRGTESKVSRIGALDSGLKIKTGVDGTLDSESTAKADPT
jgi:hypothetical protein